MVGFESTVANVNQNACWSLALTTVGTVKICTESDEIDRA